MKKMTIVWREIRIKIKSFKAILIRKMRLRSNVKI